MTKQFLIAGYYGFNNLGDDLLLDILLAKIRKKFPNSHIVVLSKNPVLTSKTFQVESIGRLHLFKIIGGLIKSDNLIFGGGGLIQNQTSNKSLYYYVGLGFLGLICRCQIFFYANGVEHVEGSFARYLISLLMKRAKVQLALRDDESKQKLVAMNIPEEKIHVTGDPVFELEIPKLKIEQPGQGVVLIPRFPVGKKDLECYQMVIRLLEDRGEPLSIVLFQSSSESRELQSIFTSPAIKKVIQYESWDQKDDVIAAIQRASGLISARFHGLVLAALLEKPFVGLGDVSKTGRVCQIWGMPHVPWGGTANQLDFAISQLKGSHQKSSFLIDQMKKSSLRTIHLLD